MDDLSIGAISAWQNQQLASRVEIRMLKKAMEIQTQSVLNLLVGVMPPATPAASAPVIVSDSPVGRQVDVWA